MTPLRRTPDDGPTMDNAELERWARELQAQREHQSRYKGHPSTPMSIHPERKRLPKRTTEPVAAIQGELRCVHRFRIEEPCGKETLEGVCKHCGETRTFSAWLPNDMTAVLGKRE